MDNAILDTDLLGELQEVMEDGLDQLLEAFLNSAEQQLSALQTAHAEQDAEALRKGAHTMKGASASVGARRLSGYFYELETTARAAQFDRASIALNLARQGLPEFEQALGQWRAAASSRREYQ